MQRVLSGRHDAVVGEPAGHVEELADGDPIAVRHRAGKPLLDRIFESDLALRDQLQHHYCGEALGHAAYPEAMARCDRHAAANIGRAGCESLAPVRALDHRCDARCAAVDDALERSLDVGVGRDVAAVGTTGSTLLASACTPGREHSQARDRDGGAGVPPQPPMGQAADLPACTARSFHIIPLG
jgi:hypothetical protein